MSLCKMTVCPYSVIKYPKHKSLHAVFSYVGSPQLKLKKNNMIYMKF